MSSNMLKKASVFVYEFHVPDFHLGKLRGLIPPWWLFVNGDVVVASVSGLKKNFFLSFYVARKLVKCVNITGFFFGEKIRYQPWRFIPGIRHEVCICVVDFS